MLNPTSLSSSAVDQFRRLLSRPAVDTKTKDEEDKRAEEAAKDKRNAATEASNYLDDQGNPQTQALNTVSKLSSSSDEARKAALKEKLRMLIEQMKSLMQFAMNDPKMAKVLAQLSREIASVAKQLGGSSPSIPTANAAAPAATPTAAPAAAQPAAEGADAAAATAGTEGAATQASGQQTAPAAAQQQKQAQGQAGDDAAEGEDSQEAATAEADAEAGEETMTMPTTAEAAAAKGQAIFEKIQGEQSKKEPEDPDLKRLLTMAKALIRQAKAAMEEMAQQARRDGKPDSLEEERKQTTEALATLEKVDAGGIGTPEAGSVVSLIA